MCTFVCTFRIRVNRDISPESYPAAMYGIFEVANVDDPHQDTHYSNSFGQEGAKLIQLPLQRGGFIRCLGHCMPDASEASLCVYTNILRYRHGTLRIVTQTYFVSGQ